MDRNKIRHDLCVAYAQALMVNALAKGTFPEEGLSETETGNRAAYMMVDWYNQCMDTMIKMKDREILDPDD